MSRQPQKQAIAAALGVSKARITSLTAAGMPLESIAAAREWFDANIRRYSKPAPTPTGRTSSHRQRLEAAEADLKELNLAVQRGELVNKAAVERDATAAAQALKHRLIEILPAAVADEGARAATVEEAEAIIRTALRTALADCLPRPEGAP